ncbi:hypothetical protein L2E82_18540 [Cichorium intybus]|uniref:Uncharacterized protein n=1 Tax=Cichorium intybus TaxID=13427 RepID=A0ACB9FBF1_CICIN|nr:hypothetical protein L2E82_18540 [Cichorium intybus]
MEADVVEIRFKRINASAKQEKKQKLLLEDETKTSRPLFELPEDSRSRVKKISVIRNLCLVELLQKGKPVIPYDVQEKTGSETEETEVKLVEEEEDGGTSESGAQLAIGEAFGVEAPAQKLDVDIAIRICISDDGPDRSLLSVETADRPGLLVDLVKIFTDINVAVESGEFGTKLPTKPYDPYNS